MKIVALLMALGASVPLHAMEEKPVEINDFRTFAMKDNLFQDPSLPEDKQIERIFKILAGGVEDAGYPSEPFTIIGMPLDPRTNRRVLNLNNYLTRSEYNAQYRNACICGALSGAITSALLLACAALTFKWINTDDETDTAAKMDRTKKSHTST